MLLGHLHNHKVNLQKRKVSYIKDTHREKAPSSKTPVLTKNMNMNIWVVSTSKQLFLRGSYTEINIQKSKGVTGKRLLYENDAFSILLLSTKKLCSSFLKKAFVFRKICFKVKVLKTFKISTDCHIKTCRSLKWRAILKSPSMVF